MPGWGPVIRPPRVALLWAVSVVLLAGCRLTPETPSPDAYATVEASILATNVALRGTPTAPPPPSPTALPATATPDARSLEFARGAGSLSARMSAALVDANRIAEDLRQGTIDRDTFLARFEERQAELARIRDDSFKLAPPGNLEEVNGLLVSAAEQATEGAAALLTAYRARDEARQTEALRRLDEATGRLRRAAELFNQRFPGARPLVGVPERAIVIAPLPAPAVKPAAGTKPATTADIVEATRAGVAFLLVDTAAGLASGSGLVVTPNGRILTNEHVVRDARSITVSLPDGRRFPGRVLRAEPGLDLALVKVDGAGLPALPLGDSDALRQGSEVIALGYPLTTVLGADLSATRGIISKVRVNLGGRMSTDVIQMDASLNPGNSGGPLLDTNGRVVGVNFAGLRNTQGVFFAIPINAARELLKTP